MKNALAVAQLTLTAAERLLLVNQYYILEGLYPACRHEYAARRHIVEQGAEQDYDALMSPLAPASDRVSVAEQPSHRFPDTVLPPTVRRSSGSASAILSGQDPNRGYALTPW